MTSLIRSSLQVVKRVDGDLLVMKVISLVPNTVPVGSGKTSPGTTAPKCSALTVNDNALDLFIKPNPQVGKPPSSRQDHLIRC
jgi:hypothetical protein